MADNTIYKNVILHKDTDENIIHPQTDVESVWTLGESPRQLSTILEELENIPVIKFVAADFVKEPTIVDGKAYFTFKVEDVAKKAILEKENASTIKVDLSEITSLVAITGVPYIWIKKNVIHNQAGYELIQYSFDNAGFDFAHALDTNPYIKMIKIGNGGAVYSKDLSLLYIAFTDMNVDTIWAKIHEKSTVSVSTTGTATEEAKYITVDGTEYKISGVPSTASLTEDRLLKYNQGSSTTPGAGTVEWGSAGTSANQKVKGNGTEFGADAAVDIKAADNSVEVTGDATAGSESISIKVKNAVPDYGSTEKDKALVVKEGTTAGTYELGWGEAGSSLIFTDDDLFETYFCVEQITNGTLTVQYSSATNFKYKVNNDIWLNIETSPTAITLNAGDKCYFKADSFVAGMGKQWSEDDGKQFKLSGNIQSLQNNSASTPENAYLTMFMNCAGLTSISANLLPATTLQNTCYGAMFMNCTGLTSLPANLLPATTLSQDCYANMFQGCTGLTILPENLLPATTLANSCYGGMFQGCINLTTLPKLPAVALAQNCYNSIFKNCSVIKLSETQTSEYVNEYRIPYAETGTTAATALENMFTDTGGTFTGTPTINKTYYTSNTVV